MWKVKRTAAKNRVNKTRTREQNGEHHKKNKLFRRWSVLIPQHSYSDGVSSLTLFSARKRRRTLEMEGRNTAFVTDWGLSRWRVFAGNVHKVQLRKWKQYVKGKRCWLFLQPVIFFLDNWSISRTFYFFLIWKNIWISRWLVLSFV